MEGHPAQSRPSCWRTCAVPLAMTLLGLVLVVAGSRHPGRTSPATSRSVVMEPSGRGALIANRQSLPPGSRGLAVETPADASHWQAPQPGLWAMTSLGGDESLAAGGELRAPAPTATPPRTEVITYVVQPGDNVWLISQRFGVSQNTIIWANDWLDMDPDLLRIGDELGILPVSGVWHTVKPGETLASIAKRYQVPPEVIAGYAPNGLQEPVSLREGQRLIIPGGIKPFEPRLVYTSAGAVTVNARPEPGRFIWPCSGVITQYFHNAHLAIDIANVSGTPIYAADAGRVTLARWAGGLGNAVRIDHGNGYVTTYGHMRAFLVGEGQYVQRGQPIGEMGSTGISTGPHVHFVIQYYGGAVNPIRYLPRP